MMYVFVVVVVGAWFAIAGVIYAWLWRAWLQEMALPGRSALNLLASALLSPGVVTGHGIAPYPGGLATLATASGHDNSLRIFNASMWVLALVLFLALDRWLRRRKARAAPH